MKLPRYRTGDPNLDQEITELIAHATKSGVNADLVFEMIVSALRMARDHADRGDMKIASAALKELRYSFSVFHPYRDQRKVSIFGSARTLPDDPLYDQTRRFAAAMSAGGWMVITGAGPGIMSAGIEGAGAENAFGVSIRLPFEAATSEFIADDPKLINFRYFFTRKLTFLKESHGFALLPGGFGTLDETFELLTLVQTGKAVPVPIVLLDVPGGTYWQSFHDFIDKELVGRGYVLPVDPGLVCVTDDVAVAVREITNFYANYHSLRFVEGDLVIRMRRLPSPGELARLNEDFADIVARGRIEEVAPSEVEIQTHDHVGLERLAFRFNRYGWTRLRQLIDRLNAVPFSDE